MTYFTSELAQEAVLDAAINLNTIADYKFNSNAWFASATAAEIFELAVATARVPRKAKQAFFLSCLSLQASRIAAELEIVSRLISASILAGNAKEINAAVWRIHTLKKQHDKVIKNYGYLRSQLLK